MSEQIRKKLVTLVKAKGLVCSRVADNAEVPRSSLSRYLSGSTDIYGRYLVRALKELGVDLDKILMEMLNKEIGGESLEQKGVEEDLLTLIHSMKGIQRKTLLQTIISDCESNSDSSVRESSERLKSYISDLKKGCEYA